MRQSTTGSAAKYTCSRVRPMFCYFVLDTSNVPGEARPFCCFSRNGNDFTSKYEAAGFGEHLKSCFKPDVTTAILDGEICAWNKQEKCIVQKGAFSI